MQIQPINQNLGPSAKTLGNNPVRTGQPETARASIRASEQALDRSIVSTSIQVSLTTGNESLGLLLKSAIEGINDVLRPELGDNAIQNAYASGLDVSPKATAERIVSLSTAFFARYAENHPEKDPQTALNDFVALISKGIDQGFKEARSILDGLQVLQGDIAANIDKTYDLVQAGLQAFVENFSGVEGQDNQSPVA